MFDDYDKNKSDRTKAERGIDFEYAKRAWLDPGAVEYSGHTSHELRTVRLARIDGTIYMVVYTMRSDLIRIISIHRVKPEIEALYGKKD